jgi:photosystem II stability/assembly factor-like uncharacterized protein
VRPKFILTVLTLALSMAACDGRTGTVMPTSPAVIAGPVGATTAPVPSATTTPVASATVEISIPPSLPVLASPVLGRIDFQDENNGWGIAVNDNGYILRTVDGGSTWLNATPPGIGPVGISASLTVLNTNTAWVLVPGMDFFSGKLYQTSDGGVTWKSNPVPFGGGFLQFLDASTGRLLADRGARDGSEAVELIQTSDGGATWVSVFHNDASQSGFSDSLPLAGIKNGLTFLDANTGWVTGSIPANGSVYLYVTHDGGVSWAQQKVPLPAEYAAYTYLPQAPVFFGKDGFLPLMVYQPERTDFTIYVTHDGGLTWSGDPTDVHKVIKPGLAAFADALHIWSWDGGPVLFISSDGAQVWEQAAATLDLSGRLSQLEFVPTPAERFTGWALTRVDEAGHSQLYRTSDSSTWMRLVP